MTRTQSHYRALVHRAVKPVFGRGSAPDPSGELTTLPQTGSHPSRLGRGAPAHTLPVPTPSASRYRLGAYGASVLKPHEFISSGYAYVVMEEGARMIFLQGGPNFEVTPLQ